MSKANLILISYVMSIIIIIFCIYLGEYLLEGTLSSNQKSIVVTKPERVVDYGEVISVRPYRSYYYHVICEKSIFKTSNQKIDIPIGVNATMVFRPDGKKLCKFSNGQTVWCD